MAGSPHSTFGTVALGYHTYRRPGHRRRGGVSAAAVFAVLLVAVGVEVAWLLHSIWRGALMATVALAEATPPEPPSAIGETSALQLRRANEALAASRWAEAGVAFDRAADRDPARLAQYRQALGWSYSRLGRGSLAREQFTQALRLDPSVQSAREGLVALGPVRVTPR